LGVHEPGSLLPPAATSPFGLAIPPSLDVATPTANAALAGLYPSTVPVAHFVVILAFGERRVSIPVSPYMPVSTLRLTAESIADRDPELLTLMHGSRALDLEAVLGDYASPLSHAFHVTVTIFPASPPVSISDRRPPNPPLSLPQPLFPASLPVTPPPIIHASFLILVVFEDGSTMAPVVWGSMSVHRLCQQIGKFFNVAPDSVYLYFAGSLLDI
jgi:hypothetical protein